MKHIKSTSITYPNLIIYLCFLVFIFFVSNSSFAQVNCASGSFALTTQAQVNNFIATHSGSGCDTIDGDLSITGSVTGISGMSFLKYINGNLYIDSTLLSNMEGLQNIEVIGGRLYIANSLLLTTISLPSLTKTGVFSDTGLIESLTIRNNNLLTDINFPNLLITESNVKIINNNPLCIINS